MRSWANISVLASRRDLYVGAKKNKIEAHGVRATWAPAVSRLPIHSLFERFIWNLQIDGFNEAFSEA